MRWLVVAVVIAAAAPAYAQRDLCVRGTVHRGAAIDLDVKNADIHDVYRLISDVGRVNVVIASDVTGRVTLRVRRVAWQQVACTIAAVHKLEILLDGNVLLVRRRQPVITPAAAGSPSPRPARRR